MWSSDFNGRRSIFNDQQRLLYPVRDASDFTKKQLSRALQHSTCTGIAVLNPNDRGVLLLVKQTLQAVYAKTPHLSRSHYLLMVTTCATWAMDSLLDRIHDILGHLHAEKLDVLLLARPHALDSTGINTSERKRIVLEHWTVMCAIQRLGLATESG